MKTILAIFVFLAVVGLAVFVGMTLITVMQMM